MLLPSADQRYPAASTFPSNHQLCGLPRSPRQSYLPSGGGRGEAPSFSCCTSPSMLRAYVAPVSDSRAQVGSGEGGAESLLLPAEGGRSGLLPLCSMVGVCERAQLERQWQRTAPLLPAQPGCQGEGPSELEVPGVRSSRHSPANRPSRASHARAAQHSEKSGRRRGGDLFVKSLGSGGTIRCYI